MVDAPIWAQHFALSENLLQQWRENGQAQSFLEWCLQTGAIDETRYLQWASAHYHLPIVKDSFFALPTVDQNWVIGKFLYRWTARLVPLEEWDGLVRIACSEPPENFQFDRPYAFVLASPRQLQGVWKRFYPEATFTSAPPLATPVVVTPVAPSATEAFDAAALLKAFNDQADAADSSANVTPPLDENGEPILAEATDELGLPDGFVAVTAPIDIPMPSLGLKKTAPPPAVEIALAPSESKVATPPEPIVAPVLTPEIASVAAPVVLKPPGTYVMPELPGAPEDFELCDTIAEVVACAFTKMSAHFQYQMALLPRDGALTPWLWSDKFTRETPHEPPEAIELATPSFFRIVARTSMPYHGHTGPSEVNDQFFKAWTRGTALPHITLIPVMLNEHAVLTLLGGMDNVMDARAALSEMEHLARTAAIACQRISEKSHSHAA